MSGVDCSGKTTQLELLAERLRAKGYPTRRFWYRPGYSKNLDALRSLIRSLRSDALPPPGPSEKRDAAFSNPRLRAAWLSMALADTLVELGLRLRYYLARGEVVLCDRFISDGLLDLRLRFPGAVSTARLSPILQFACPRPDLHALLHLDWDEVQARTRLKDEPFPDPEPVRVARHRAYCHLASLPNITMINGQDSIDAVHEQLWEHVQRLLVASPSSCAGQSRILKT